MPKRICTKSRTNEDPIPEGTREACNDDPFRGDDGGVRIGLNTDNATAEIWAGLTADCAVEDGSDLLRLLLNWGSCP